MHRLCAALLCANYAATLGCSSTRLVVVPNQPEAVVSAVDPKTGEPGAEIGRGQVELSGENLNGKAYVVRKSGFESVLFYLPSGGGDNQLAIRMNEVDSEVAKRLAQAQAELENLRKTLALEVEKGKTAAANAEKVLDIALRAQHFISLGNAKNAKLALDQVDSAIGNGASVPAVVDLLKAKERLLAGDKAGAVAALDSALGKNTTVPEAKRLRDALQK